MKKVVLICVLFFQIIFSSFSLSQTTALQFLVIPTNAEMIGMGYASVAHITNNPAALTFNPSHLGMQCLDNEVASFGTNYFDWLPTYRLDMWTRTFTATAGLNLKKYYPKLLPLSIGLSYANTHMNYGKFIITTPTDPDGLLTLDKYDESNQITLSVASEYYVRGSIGYTYKHITSHYPESSTANLYDVGLLVDVPVISIISKITDKPITLSNDMSPFCNFSVGLSKSNLGQESVSYADTAQKDAIPRYARAGIECAFGLYYFKDGFSWIPFSFKWTIEANSSLAPFSYGFATKQLEYRSGLGDINFFKEVILGKGNKETEKLKGWELNFYETVYLYGGSFTEDPERGGRNFTTGGYAIRLSGMLKTIVIFEPEVFENKFMKYLLNHIDIKFNKSTINAGESWTPLVGTKYYSLNIFWSNWGI